MSVQPVYELRYKINKFSFEFIGRYFLPALAYGMRKKLSQESPAKYPLNKLIVRKL